MCVTVCMWKSEDSFRELILPFHYVGSRDLAHVVRVGAKYL